MTTMTEATQDILVHTEAGVTTITFNRVDKKNSITTRMYAAMADALAAVAAQRPYAVAVNTTFVPAAQHASHPLQDGDRMEVISPVTGG